MNSFSHMIAAVFFLFAVAPGAHGNDRPVFDRTDYQLGSLSEGRVHQFAIPLKNTAGRPLHILSVEATCVYMEASIDRTDVAPGETATLTVQIDAGGNLGRLAKIVEILNTFSSEPYILTIRGTIMHREYDRGQPRLMFSGACEKCHVGTPIGTKEGQELYDAVCYLCHKDSLLSSASDAAAVRRIVAKGVPGTSMPGFAGTAGGPLTMPQIDSLAGLITSKHPPSGK
jgi:uncharacterized protein DUF1573/cbb3-type cytochrome c oxidase subunit III